MGEVKIFKATCKRWMATDLPEILGNLRANLLRNTRGRCRYTPQAAALSLGPDVERIYPRFVYRYDYVLAADVVYHHDYLEELLFTMRYFCRPGTTLIWANKTDLSFTEDFQNTFNTTLLAEMGERSQTIRTQMSQQQERPVWVEEFVVEKDRSEEQDKSLEKEEEETSRMPLTPPCWLRWERLRSLWPRAERQRNTFNTTLLAEMGERDRGTPSTPPCWLRWERLRSSWPRAERQRNTFNTPLLAEMGERDRGTPSTPPCWLRWERLRSSWPRAERQRNTFNTTLLAEMGEVKIFKATCKSSGSSSVCRHVALKILTSPISASSVVLKVFWKSSVKLRTELQLGECTYSALLCYGAGWLSGYPGSLA
ncbi:unnamed protein product, partial [Coregonus sp. 'balchen']